jgi:hypothetical protein
MKKEWNCFDICSFLLQPLRRALHKIGGPQLGTTLMPDTMENGLSYSVLNYLKRLKNQAKIEFDRLCNDVGKKTAQPGLIEGIRVQARTQLKKDLVSHPLLQGYYLFLYFIVDMFIIYLYTISHL